MKRFAVLGVVFVASLVLDQLTKLWAADRLQQGCAELGRSGAGVGPRIARCRADDLRLELGAAASRLTVAGSAGVQWSLSCEGAEACLRGNVRVGEARPGARGEGKAPALRGGQPYTATVQGPAGASTLRFAYERPGPHIAVIEGYLDLEWAENRGAAFSFLANSPGVREPVLIAIAIAASLFILWLARKLKPGQHLLATALALVLAGAIGNLIDRIRLSYVIDFIAFHIRDGFRWPTFNVADAAIVIGVGLLLIDSLRGWLRERRAKKKTA